MKPLIKALILKNFRSFKHEHIDFDNPTFVIGRNGSGKSNLVDALSLMSEAMNNPLRSVFEKRGGVSSIGYRSPQSPTVPRQNEGSFGICLILGEFANVMSCRYSFEIAYNYNQFVVAKEQCQINRKDGSNAWFEKSPDSFKSNFENLNPAFVNNALAMPLLSGIQDLAPVVSIISAIRTYSIVPGKIRELQEPDNGFYLNSDGSNAASVISELAHHDSERLKQVCDALSLIAPNIKGLLHVSQGNKLSLNFLQEYQNGQTVIFDGLHMSDGTMRALGILLAIYQFFSPSLLVFEEPEATLHFSALSSLLDIIRHASNFRQIVVTTHSNDLLESKDIAEENLRVAEWHNGESTIRTLDAASKAILKEHLMVPGELIRSNALQTNPKYWTAPDLELFEELKA